MNFYEKYYASNYEELITYYPRFYRDVFEMVEILKAHGRITDGIEHNIEQTYLNGFIDYADKATIEKLENFLGTGLNRSGTLEERRRLVKSYFIGFGKISASQICRILSYYTNALVNCRFEPFDEQRNNILFIDFQQTTTTPVYVNEIYILLSKKLPAHIAWRMTITFRSAEGKLHLGGSIGADAKLGIHEMPDKPEFYGVLHPVGNFSARGELGVREKPDKASFQDTLHTRGNAGAQSEWPVLENRTAPTATTILRTGGVTTILSNISKGD